MKKKEAQSEALRRALARQSAESHKAIYESLIRHEREHLEKCGKPRCVECRDAKALLPYYRARLKRGSWTS